MRYFSQLERDSELEIDDELEVNSFLDDLDFYTLREREHMMFSRQGYWSAWTGATAKQREFSKIASEVSIAAVLVLIEGRESLNLRERSPVDFFEFNYKKRRKKAIISNEKP
jgi:hypothetical protein